MTGRFALRDVTRQAYAGAPPNFKSKLAAPPTRLCASSFSIQACADQCSGVPTEVDEVEDARGGVVEEVAPVGVGLHEAPLKQLLERQLQQQGAHRISHLLRHLRHLPHASTVHQQCISIHRAHLTPLAHVPLCKEPKFLNLKDRRLRMLPHHDGHLHMSTPLANGPDLVTWHRKRMLYVENLMRSCGCGRQTHMYDIAAGATSVRETDRHDHTHLVDVGAGHELGGEQAGRAEVRDDPGHVDVGGEVRVGGHELPELLLAARLIRVVALQRQLPLRHLPHMCRHVLAASRLSCEVFMPFQNNAPIEQLPEPTAMDHAISSCQGLCYN